jgi:ubiquinone/menaquinone biosynthesis C-methylase UbiE
MNNPSVTSNARNLYDVWHVRLANEDAGLHSWHRNVAKFLDLSPGSRLLEIGCGRGHFASYIARRFPEAEVTGVDFSEAAIGIAATNEQIASPNLSFRVGNATALEFADSGFDVVVSCECLEHVPSPDLMAREIGRVLRPGGSFYVTTENYLNGMALMWAKAWITGVPIDTGSGTQPHENFFLFWRVRRMLERNGLGVTHMESDNFQWLMLPKVSPDKLSTQDFRNPRLKRLFRAFGRHFLFAGVRS